MTGGGLNGVVVVQVAAGDGHSIALTAAGELYTWGGGGCGRLGHGDVEDQSVPRAVNGTGALMGMAGGDKHSLVTTREGRVLGFGNNANGQLGLEMQGTALTPAVVGDLSVIDNDDDGEDKEGKE